MAMMAITTSSSISVNAGRGPREESLMGDPTRDEVGASAAGWRRTGARRRGGRAHARRGAGTSRRTGRAGRGLRDGHGTGGEARGEAGPGQRAVSGVPETGWRVERSGRERGGRFTRAGEPGHDGQ